MAFCWVGKVLARFMDVAGNLIHIKCPWMVVHEMFFPCELWGQGIWQALNCLASFLVPVLSGVSIPYFIFIMGASWEGSRVRFFHFLSRVPTERFRILIISSTRQIVVEGQAEFLGKFLSFMTRAAFGTGDGLRLFYIV